MPYKELDELLNENTTEEERLALSYIIKKEHYLNLRDFYRSINESWVFERGKESKDLIRFREGFLNSILASMDKLQCDMYEIIKDLRE